MAGQDQAVESVTDRYTAQGVGKCLLKRIAHRFQVQLYAPGVDHIEVLDPDGFVFVHAQFIRALADDMQPHIFKHWQNIRQLNWIVETEQLEADDAGAFFARPVQAHAQVLRIFQGVIIGGAACPISVIKDFRIKHDVAVHQAWGMTEMTPVGTVNTLKSGMEDLTEDELDQLQLKQGRFVYGVEMKNVDDDNNDQQWLVLSGNRAVYQTFLDCELEDEDNGYDDKKFNNLILTVSVIDGKFKFGGTADADGFGDEGQDTMRMLIQTAEGDVIFENQRDGGNGASPARDVPPEISTGKVTKGNIKIKQATTGTGSSSGGDDDDDYEDLAGQEAEEAGAMSTLTASQKVNAVIDYLMLQAEDENIDEELVEKRRVIQKLSGAINKFEAGNDTKACIKLTNFNNIIAKLMAKNKISTPLVGTTLIDMVDEIKLAHCT